MSLGGVVARRLLWKEAIRTFIVKLHQGQVALTTTASIQVPAVDLVHTFFISFWLLTQTHVFSFIEILSKIL